MSRNLCSTSCRSCGGHVVVVSDVRICRSPADVPERFASEFRGMIVADACCCECGSAYLAWMANIPGERSTHGTGDEALPRDLSFRYSFDDEMSSDRSDGPVIPVNIVEGNRKLMAARFWAMRAKTPEVRS